MSSEKVSQFIAGFEQYLVQNKGRAEGTGLRYRQIVERLVDWCEANDLTLATVTREQIERWAGPELHQEGVKARSRLPFIAALRGFFRWARRNGLRPDNPAAGLPYPNAGKPLPTALSLQSAETLLASCDLADFRGARDAAIIAVFTGCGLRLSGLAALNEQDLQFVRFQEQEHLIIRAREKGRKDREVPAPHEARLLIRAYLGHPDLADIDRTLPDGDRVLWASTRNHNVPPHAYYGEARRLATSTIREMIVTRGEAAGIPRKELHPHAMRHLYGTELAEEGIPTLQLQALMGHTDPKTTEIYTRLASRRLITAAHRGNPLGKIKTPVTDLLKELRTQ